MLLMGPCPVSDNGNIGIRVPASGTHVVAMCDECLAVWRDKLLMDGPWCPRGVEGASPTDGSSLRSAPAHWATREEAEKAGWLDVVIAETEAFLS
jgi:hypothetical protein